ncbi:LuxR C-terminal-related transcriptional regulator [Primorskyibacter sedentarius]|uniref:LuxR family two component transcriptional regulator n=1 Tax=Primorskyibacter sedentarius TaxID=745311 RepID=A0A4R3JM33_9RHOB|nr:response regulator transcription factor [Primorskyibacter sedentarius]TCS67438.1 LuxR family two component transcriptional regulator [Primorskyibacter sedentarius]
MPVTLLVADDHAFTLDGMQRALSQIDGFEVVAVAHTGIEAIAQARAHRPDIAVLDIAMPGANGLEVVVELSRWSPETCCVIVTGSPTPGVLHQLQALGVRGMFVKSADPNEICEGIKQIAAGETVIAPEIQQRLDDEDASNALSERELEVLQLIARGLTNSGIADALSISPKTVESHRASLMRKLKVHSVAQLLIRAVRDGLISV